MQFKFSYEKIAFTLLIVIIFNASISNGNDVNSEDESYESGVSINKRRRVKRFLSFRPGMRFLFRVNGREDALYDLNTWAHAYGFRANYDIIQPLHSFPFHFINRRSVHDEVENLFELHHELDGKACLLKTFCDATGWNNSNGNNLKSGMFFKLFQTVFSKRTKYLDEDYDCRALEEQCPLHLLELLTYTDI